ncbi:MAG: hypothetical protein ACKOFP_07815, partial [Actinomycetota bacterium]
MRLLGAGLSGLLALSAVGTGPAWALAPAQETVATEQTQASRLTPRNTPVAPRLVWSENFENGTTSAPTSLNYGGVVYRGAQGNTYTGTPVWIDPNKCNGIIVNSQAPSAAYYGCGSLAMDNLRQVAYGLGQFSATTPTATNHVLSELSQGILGTGIMFQGTGLNTSYPVNGRFLYATVDAGAIQCASADDPIYQFEYTQDGGTTWSTLGPQTNVCAAGQIISLPALGAAPAKQGAFLTINPGSTFRYTGTSLGVRVANRQGGGNGNDGGIDNVRVFDASPSMYKSFSPTSMITGQRSLLTFTIVNTNELGAKAGWSFTDTLPVGL